MKDFVELFRPLQNHSFCQDSNKHCKVKEICRFDAPGRMPRWQSALDLFI
jgi:hypothetical protein